jgi:K+-transporting ATPase ATPase C chain
MRSVYTPIRLIILFTIITGVVYPLSITLCGYLFFAEKAHGSPAEKSGKIIGSYLIGQKFTSPKYFHGRPSASDYNPGASGGSNLGPSNKTFSERIADDAASARKLYGLRYDAKIPADLIMTSASGLDPHISIDAALIQCDAVARARNTDTRVIENMVHAYAEKRYFNFTGDRYINVLRLNIALDERMK